jgi:ubiquinone/menaquinone biosynthesis C-methylase UbiE
MFNARQEESQLMEKKTDWKQFWEERSTVAASDFAFDHGLSPGTDIETLSKDELLEFIDPKPDEIIFDAGCGTGGNVLLLHSKVKYIVGMDYSQGAVDRCQRRINSNGLKNVEVIQGSIKCVPLRDCSVDKVLCMSVLQYLTNAEVRTSFAEFRRILKDGGTLILHVKNISSLYLATLWLAKSAKVLLRMSTKVEHYRSYRWYVSELEALGFTVLAYNSFNLFTVQGMPMPVVRFLRKLEFKYRNTFPFRLSSLRRHGAELKIKAQLVR